MLNDVYICYDWFQNKKIGAEIIMQKEKSVKIS
jgi:hypothetical protein